MEGETGENGGGGERERNINKNLVWGKKMGG